MRTIHTILGMLAILLTASLTLSSCDSDDDIGYDLSGSWYGDLGMYNGNERAAYSEIYFHSRGGVFDWKNGTGYEIDYYRRTDIRHDFDYEVRNGIIYLDFDDHSLDCSIRDYHISRDRFWGYIDGHTSSVYFDLDRSRSRYSSDYRNSYYDSYRDGRRVKAVGTPQLPQGEWRNVNVLHESDDQQ